eukprot:COSAG06_NODE_2153_length_7463_cov_7.460483_1_plen_57_part_10
MGSTSRNLQAGRRKEEALTPGARSASSFSQTRLAFHFTAHPSTVSVPKFIRTIATKI